MLVAIDLGENESPVWNLMHQMYVPCERHVAKLGYDYEDAKLKFNHYARHGHDSTDVLSAVVYLKLMASMDEAKKRLSPYINEWYCARHGYSLN